MRLIILTSILLIVLSLSSCGPQALPTPSPPSPRTAPTLSATDVIATLRRSGGFAGRTDSFVIKADGAVDVGSITRRVEGGPGAAAKLATQLAATGIYDVAPGKYMPAVSCCDRFTYDLTLVKDGKSYSYTTMDGSETAPRALVDAVALLQQYINAAR